MSKAADRFRRALEKPDIGYLGRAGARVLAGAMLVATIVAGCDGSGTTGGAGGSSGAGGTGAASIEAGTGGALAAADAAADRAQDSSGEVGIEASRDADDARDAGADASRIEQGGCTYIGNLDHFGVFRRDVARDLCLTLVLVFPGQAPPAGLTLPDRVGLIAAGAAPGWACSSGGYIAIHADQVSGVVEAKSIAPSGDPGHLRVDVTFSFGANDAGVEPMERMVIDDIDVAPSCPAPACTFGADQTCNDNPAISSLHGRCTPAATCICNSGFALNPSTGRCL